MNKSIAKTRNQLQRITYKINQLKTKYTGQANTPELNNTQNYTENSPYTQSKNQLYPQNMGMKTREPLSSIQMNRQINHNSNLNVQGNINMNSMSTNPISVGTASKQIPKSTTMNLNMGHNNVNEQILQKDFKIFRTQIYNYIDKCLLSYRERQGQVIEKTIRNYIENSNTKKPDNDQSEQRVKKLEQQTTTCITSIQQIITQFKKNQKSTNQKIVNLQLKLRKEMKQMRDKQNKLNGNKNELGSEQLFEKVLKNIQTTIQNKISLLNPFETEPEQTKVKLQQLQERLKKMSKNNQTYQNQVQKMKQKLDKIQRLQRSIKEQKNRVTEYQSNIHKLESKIQNQIKMEITQINQSMKHKLDNFSQKVDLIQYKYEQVHKNDYVVRQQLQQTRKKCQLIQSKLKSLQKNTESLSQSQNGKGNTQTLEQLTQSLKKQVQSNIESSYLKPRLEQFKRQISTKLNQQIEFNKQQILISVQQTIFQKVNKFVNISQEKSRKSPKCQADQSRLIIKQQVKQIQSQLKGLVCEEIQVKLEQYTSKINNRLKNISSTPIYSYKQKSQQSQGQRQKQKQTNRVLNTVQQKLSQFESDINQTIRLLYQDIQAKVNELLTNSGVLDIRSQIEVIKQNIKLVDENIKILSTAVANLSHAPTPNINNGNTLSNFSSISQKTIVDSNNVQERLRLLQSLRQDVYNDMGIQIEKLSNILERTVQQMEHKVQKLDQNFSYVYDRMSKIQYDNANFKDKLTSLIANQKVQLCKSQVSVSPLHHNLKKSNSGLLDALGSYNVGGYFYER